MKHHLILVTIMLLEAILTSIFAQGNYEVIALNNGEEVDMTSIHFCTLSGRGLFATIGNQMVGMDKERNGDYEILSLPDTTFSINEIVVLPKLVVCKSDSNILYLNQYKRLRGFSLDTEDFHISYASDSSIYIMQSDKVFESKIIKGKPALRFQYEGHRIIYYMPIKDYAYVVTENQLLLKNEEKLMLLLEMPETINAVNISSHGILIGTSSALFRYDSIGTLQLIVSDPISQILNDGDYLYIITGNSSIYRLQRLNNDI